MTELKPLFSCKYFKWPIPLDFIVFENKNEKNYTVNLFPDPMPPSKLIDYILHCKAVSVEDEKTIYAFLKQNGEEPQCLGFFILEVKHFYNLDINRNRNLDASMSAIITYHHFGHDLFVLDENKKDQVFHHICDYKSDPLYADHNANYLTKDEFETIMSKNTFPYRDKDIEKIEFWYKKHFKIANIPEPFADLPSIIN